METQELVLKSFEAGYDVASRSVVEEVSDEIAYITKAIEKLPRYTIRDVEKRPDSDEYIDVDHVETLMDRLSALTAPKE
jgi:hypothetical protein